jgi:hypothetical protein
MALMRVLVIPCAAVGIFVLPRLSRGWLIVVFAIIAIVIGGGAYRHQRKLRSGL